MLTHSRGAPLPAGVLRWLVDVSTWEPKQAEWELLLETLPSECRKRVMAFKFKPDQKRALVSRLLQRRASAEVMGIPQSAVKIERTKGGKPYLASRPRTAHGAASNVLNWNFNVSHEGHFVALAAEPVLLCGIDIAAPELVRSGSQRNLEERFELMSNQFTPHEWRTIRACGPDEAQMEAMLRKHWSLKEAYTKGRGDGIAFGLQNCEFHFDGAQVAAVSDGGASGVERASVVVGGRELPSWRFYLQPLPDNHWISVARGPPSDVVDHLGAFKATFQQLNPPAADVVAHLSRPEPPFQTKRVRDLVPQEHLSRYLAAQQLD